MAYAISFTPDMVLAILKGWKTQTRRPIHWLKKADRYGQAGDLLFVVEEFKVLGLNEKESEATIEYSDGTVRYVKVSENTVEHIKANFSDGRKGYAAEMTQDMSRIWLKNKGVGEEQLQDISESDATEEGIEINAANGGWLARDYSARVTFFQDFDEKAKNYVPTNRIGRESFRTLWESIYPAHTVHAWTKNPKVMVVGFEMIEQAKAS